MSIGRSIKRRSMIHRTAHPSCTEESYLVVPIMSSDTVFGVINIQSDLQHAFDDDDMGFVADSVEPGGDRDQ